MLTRHDDVGRNNVKIIIVYPYLRVRCQRDFNVARTPLYALLLLLFNLFFPSLYFGQNSYEKTGRDVVVLLYRRMTVTFRIPKPPYETRELLGTGGRYDSEYHRPEYKPNYYGR